jgi:hypothetical protein
MPIPRPLGSLRLASSGLLLTRVCERNGEPGMALEVDDEQEHWPTVLAFDGSESGAGGDRACRHLPVAFQQ